MAVKHTRYKIKLLMQTYSLCDRGHAYLETLPSLTPLPCLSSSHSGLHALLKMCQACSLYLKYPLPIIAQKAAFQRNLP